MRLKGKNSNHFDVIIIGGGPAGCAAGLTILDKTPLDVCIVESTDYANMRVGESVSPGIMPLMRYLGIEDEFASNGFLPSYGIDASWGSPNIHSRDFFFSGQGNGWNLDRRRFDRMMADAIIKRNGLLLTRTKIVLDCNDGSEWSFTAITPDDRFSLSCDFVVDASGRNSFFVRNNRANWHVLDYLVGIASLYDLPENAGEQTYTVVESVPDGWWYSTQLPNNKRMVVFMTDSDIAKNIKANQRIVWKSLLKNTIHIKKTLVGAKLVEGPTIFPAYSRVIKKFLPSNWVPAGDAAASFDPLSSIGIGHALVSGIESARVANNVIRSNGCLFESYVDNVIENFSNYVRNRKHFYSLEKRWPNNLFWKRRQTSNL